MHILWLWPFFISLSSPFSKAMNLFAFNLTSIYVLRAWAVNLHRRSQQKVLLRSALHYDPALFALYIFITSHKWSAAKLRGKNIARCEARGWWLWFFNENLQKKSMFQFQSCSINLSFHAFLCIFVPLSMMFQNISFYPFSLIFNIPLSMLFHKHKLLSHFFNF